MTIIVEFFASLKEQVTVRKENFCTEYEKNNVTL